MEAPRYELSVPYDGDELVFLLIPDPVSWGGPPPEAQIQPGRLLLTWHQPAEAGSAAQIRTWFDRQIDAINGFLNQLCVNIGEFNQQLPALARGLITGRRGRLQHAQDVATALGYRIRWRSDAADFEVPVRRRMLAPRPQPRVLETSLPEYSLGSAEYEAALAVLERQRNALERSPSLTAKLDEEQIRLLLLIGLNAVFEGQVMAEVFNALGKTDILIRVGDNNVFVAECKIWAGSAKFAAAIDELLGYLTWRDTKGALLLFIRNLDVTVVIAQAVAVIEAHPCYLETLPITGDGARRDFILHAKNDTARLLRLAFLPFALRTP